MTKGRSGKTGTGVVRHTAVFAILVCVASLLGIAAASAVTTEELRVVSIGDSFMAGTGVGNYYDGQGPGPAPGPRVPEEGRNCYQSYSSYPWQYTSKLVDSGQPAAIWHAACHGAHTGDLIPQWETVPQDWQDDAQIVLVSAGGNDANFSSIVENCLLNVPGGQTCDGALAFANDELDTIIGRLEAALTDVARQNRRARIAVVGYPYLASPAFEKCVFGRGQSELNDLQNRHDLALISMVGRLNTAVADRFSAVLVSGRFLGRGPCDNDDPLLHHLSLTEGHSFHPNFNGAEMYAQVLMDAGLHTNLPAADSTELIVLDEACVVYDSRLAGDDPMDGEETRTVQVTGPLSANGGASDCVPHGATSAVVSVTAVSPLTEGNLRLSPAGVPVGGGAGVVNYGANELDNTNTVIVPVSASGAFDVGANAGFGQTIPTTHVRLTILGYNLARVGPVAGFVPVNPCAVLDTRPSKNANSSFAGPAGDGTWSAGSNLPGVDVVGEFASGQGGLNGTGNSDGRPDGCGVPGTASSVMVNVVAVNPSGGSGRVTVGVVGGAPTTRAATPFAELEPGLTNGSTAFVNLLGGEEIAVSVDGETGAETQVRVEVLGYVAHDEAAGDFSPVTPCTFFDSRSEKGAEGIFEGLRRHGPAHATTYQVAGDIPIAQGRIEPAVPGGATGDCDVPSGASSVLVNFEAVNAVREGNLWVSAAGTSTTGGVLNFNALDPKMNNANAVVVPLDAQGRIQVEVNAGSHTEPGTETTQVRGSVLGYFNQAIWAGWQHRAEDGADPK